MPISFAGGRQNAQGSAERAGDIARTLRPHPEAAGDHRVGMIAAAFLLYIFLLNGTHPQGSGHGFILILPSKELLANALGLIIL